MCLHIVSEIQFSSDGEIFTKWKIRSKQKFYVGEGFIWSSDMPFLDRL